MKTIRSLNLLQFYIRAEELAVPHRWTTIGMDDYVVHDWDKIAHIGEIDEMLFSAQIVNSLDEHTNCTSILLLQTSPTSRNAKTTCKISHGWDPDWIVFRQSAFKIVHIWAVCDSLHVVHKDMFSVGGVAHCTVLIVFAAMLDDDIDSLKPGVCGRHSLRIVDIVNIAGEDESAQGGRARRHRQQGFFPVSAVRVHKETTKRQACSFET